MSQRSLIRVTGVLTTVVWVAVSIARGASLDASLLSSFGAVLALVAFLMALLDRYLWRAPLIRLAFRRRRPLVRGTWRGHAASSRRDRPYDGYLVLEQTLSRISVRMLTEDGSSETLASSWGTSDNQNPAIFYVWRHFPNAPPSNPDTEDGVGFIHHGAGVLEICGSGPYELRGPYWTDQGHTGEMAFNAYQPELCGSHPQAQRLFSRHDPRPSETLVAGG